MDVLIDLDPTVYACGFASQTTSYQCLIELASGEQYPIIFSPKDGTSAGDLMKSYIKACPEGSYVVDKHKLVSPQPIDYCLHIVSNSILAQCTAINDKFPGCDADSFRFFLSGSNNYRHRIAKQRPYKGNRLPESRPYHYQRIRDYMEEKFFPYISAGNEADDEISIAAERAKTQHRDTCVVSIDKDLDQIEGWHYNPDKKVFYNQDRDSAICYFYQQVLSGDSTDNIPGCFRIGKEKAAAMIAEWTADYEGINLDAERELWGNIIGVYRSSANKTGCPYSETDADAVALETARLVYIQKAPNELYNPPGVAYGRIDDFLRSAR
jgi:hypothetical protein